MRHALLFLPLLCSAQVLLWVGDFVNISTGISNLDDQCIYRVPGARALVCSATLDVRQFFSESYDVQTRTNTSGWNVTNPIAQAGSVFQTLFTNSTLGGTIRDWDGGEVTYVATSCYGDGTKVGGMMCGGAYTDTAS